MADMAFRSMHSINLMLLWKHDNLDKNSDKVLDENELDSVKQTLNTINKNCTKAVLVSCNVNKDLYLSKSEWIGCMGFKSNRRIDEKPIKLQGTIHFILLFDTLSSSSSSSLCCQPVRKYRPFSVLLLNW